MSYRQPGRICRWIGWGKIASLLYRCPWSDRDMNYSWRIQAWFDGLTHLKNGLDRITLDISLDPLALFCSSLEEQCVAKRIKILQVLRPWATASNKADMLSGLWNYCFDLLLRISSSSGWMSKFGPRDHWREAAASSNLSERDNQVNDDILKIWWKQQLFGRSAGK